MAEIKIEKKKQVWPWVLVGLVIVALLVYFMVFYDNGKNTETATEADYITNTNETDLMAVNENNSTVAAYVNFVENNNGNMGLDHEFTNEALTKLIEAVNAMANEVGYEVQGDIDNAKKHAKLITNDPFETTHAESIKKADEIISKVLQNIQQAKYPGLANEAAALNTAWESINPDVLTLDQKEKVKAFFDKAADILHKMN